MSDLSHEQATALRQELFKLSKQQQEALTQAVFLRMSPEESEAYEHRQNRIAEINSLLATLWKRRWGNRSTSSRFICLENNQLNRQAMLKLKYRRGVITDELFTAFGRWGRLQTVRQSNSIRGSDEMKMTEQQKREYKAYRKECKVSNVEPVRADFLMGEIPSAIEHQLELQKPHQAAQAATA
jgi:hypothetical protein